MRCCLIEVFQISEFKFKIMNSEFKCQTHPNNANEYHTMQHMQHIYMRNAKSNKKIDVKAV